MAYNNIEQRRAYSRSHYRANSAIYKQRATDFTKRERLRINDLKNRHLRVGKCVDCEEKDIRCLQFDHRDGEEKLFTIGESMREGYSVATVEKEIAKCDIRCGNCHRIKTYRERGFTHRDTPVPVCMAV